MAETRLEPPTFRLKLQCANHYTTMLLHFDYGYSLIQQVVINKDSVHVLQEEPTCSRLGGYKKSNEPHEKKIYCPENLKQDTLILHLNCFIKLS